MSACPASPTAEQQWACRRCSAVGLVRQGTSRFPASTRNDSPAARERAAPYSSLPVAETGRAEYSRLSARQIGFRSVPWLSWGVLVRSRHKRLLSSIPQGAATGPPKRHPRGWRKLIDNTSCARSSRACHAGCSPAPRAPRPGGHPARQSLAAPPTPASGLR